MTNVFDRFDPGLSDTEPYEDPAEEEKDRRGKEAYDAELKARLRTGEPRETAERAALEASWRARRSVDRELEG